MTPNTTFTTQTVLCRAPYCLALSMYNTKEAYLTYTPASVVKKLFEVLYVGYVHTTSTAQFRLHYLQMKSRKYVCLRFH